MILGHFNLYKVVIITREGWSKLTLKLVINNLYIVVIITILNGCYKLEEGLNLAFKLVIITHCGGQINPWKLRKQTCV